ncbi:MAG TPA: hypothetical protein VG105_08990 [Paraburkholderia sp.]|jgi:hypothetical protein|nr:hypothetical protein [Paraburkholderia sp.]
MKYLLGANTLIDLCYPMTPATQWAQTIPVSDCCLSVISVATTRDVIDRAPLSSPDRLRLNLAFRSRLATFTNGGAHILPFDRLEADLWQAWRSHVPLDISRNGALHPANQDTRMVIATAFAHGLELVEPAEAYHSELTAHGLTVHSL